MEQVMLVVVGAIIGAVPTLILGWMRFKSEEKKQLRALAIEVALTEYKCQCELSRGQNVTIPPPITYVPGKFDTVKTCLGPQLSFEELDKIYKNLAENGKTARNLMNKHLK